MVMAEMLEQDIEAANALAERLVGLPRRYRQAVVIPKGFRTRHGLSHVGLAYFVAVSEIALKKGAHVNDSFMCFERDVVEIAREEFGALTGGAWTLGDPNLDVSDVLRAIEESVPKHLLSIKMVPEIPGCLVVALPGLTERQRMLD